MKLKAKLVAIAIAIGTIFTPALAGAQSLWYPASNNLRPVSNSFGLQIPLLGVAGNPCVTVSATGVFSTQSCAGASSTIGITSLNGSTSSTQSFATSTATNTFTVTTAAGVHTFKIPSNVGFFSNDSGYLTSALTALNGLLGPTLTIAASSTGTDFTVSTSTNQININLPTASASNRGLLSTTDWSTFNGKQAAGNYITALTGDVTASGPGSVAATIAANAVALTTDTTGNYLQSLADDGQTTITVNNGVAEGGAATLRVIDVSCTDCLGTTEIADSYLLNTGDTGAGDYTFSGITTLATTTATTAIIGSTNTPSSTLHVVGTFRATATSTFDTAIAFSGEIQPDGSTCSVGQILKKAGADDWDCAADDNSGSATAWDAINDPSGAGSIAMAETVQSLDWNTGAVAALGVDYFTLTDTNDAASDVLTQRLFVLDHLAASTNGLEVMQRITNSDASTIATGLLIDGGVFTTAIDVSDSDIVTALSIGANDILTSGATISAAELNRLDGVSGALYFAGGTDVAIADGGTATSTVPAALKLLVGNGSSYDLLTATAGSGITVSTSTTALTIASTLGTSVDLSSEVTGTLPISGTALVAGRSLTLSTNTVDADAELYTFIKNIALTAPTTTDDGFVQLKFNSAATITRISCSVDSGSSTIQFDERAESTPNTAGTDVMTAALVCDTDSQVTTSFTNASMAANAVASMDVDAISGTPGVIRVHVEYTNDD